MSPRRGTPDPAIGTAEYELLLRELKEKVHGARLRAQRTVNTQLIQLYWSIGAMILDRQRRQGWGSNVIERLAKDLRREFPTMSGLSRSNLHYMRAFAAAWPDEEVIVQQAVGQLPWGHVTVLLDKLDERQSRDWYAQAAAEYGWSRNVLLNQIMNRSLERNGAAPSNFVAHLEPRDSELAQEIAKDPYVFDFLDLTGEVAERELETALMDRMVETLRELGAGFAFVGRQVHFDVDGDNFYIDLLFFHVEQLRYIVLELKQLSSSPSTLASSASTSPSSMTSSSDPRTHRQSEFSCAPTATSAQFDIHSAPRPHRWPSPPTPTTRYHRPRRQRYLPTPTSPPRSTKPDAKRARH